MNRRNGAPVPSSVALARLSSRSWSRWGAVSASCGVRGRCEGRVGLATRAGGGRRLDRHHDVQPRAVGPPHPLHTRCSGHPASFVCNVCRLERHCSCTGLRPSTDPTAPSRQVSAGARPHGTGVPPGVCSKCRVERHAWCTGPRPRATSPTSVEPGPATGGGDPPDGSARCLPTVPSHGARTVLPHSCSCPQSHRRQWRRRVLGAILR